MVEFLMPSLGADMDAGTLVEWRKKVGDTVKKGDIIADVETQKGLIEIEIFEDGIIEKLLVEPGVKVPVGTVLAIIKTETNNLAATPKTQQQDVVHPIIEKQQVVPRADERQEKRIKISPLAKRMATENDIDIYTLTGSGENGAITKEDVEKVIAEKQKHTSLQEPARASSENKKQDVSASIRAAVAAAMAKSNREIPHYYLEKKINMLNALAWMGEANKQRTVENRLLPAALLIKATALALRDVPELNAVWESTLLLKKQINVGFVVSLRGGGIVVPAIHQADTKSVDEIMLSLNDMIPRARALKLKSSELSDSTVTITSIGDGGADVVYGIIYPPQVAIIGFGAISQQPVAENGLLGVQPVVQVTLAGDHRATDGLTGSRFLTSLNKYLQNPETL
jgi:pyruvate dehydrogenase E2 component (dihydrolipoamide acetyltransferase)